MMTKALRFWATMEQSSDPTFAYSDENQESLHMAILREKTWRDLYPVHAILLGFPIALFCSALIADVAYLQTAEMQWSNFSAWLITGALSAGCLVLAWAAIALVIDWQRKDQRKRHLHYVLILIIMLALGLVNILKHSMDAWSSVETFGFLSILCTCLRFLRAQLRTLTPAEGRTK